MNPGIGSPLSTWRTKRGKSRIKDGNGEQQTAVHLASGLPLEMQRILEIRSQDSFPYRQKRGWASLTGHVFRIIIIPPFCQGKPATMGRFSMRQRPVQSKTLGESMRVGKCN